MTTSVNLSVTGISAVKAPPVTSAGTPLTETKASSSAMPETGRIKPFSVSRPEKRLTTLPVRNEVI